VKQHNGTNGGRCLVLFITSTTTLMESFPSLSCADALWIYRLERCNLCYIGLEKVKHYLPSLMRCVLLPVVGLVLSWFSARGPGVLLPIEEMKGNCGSFPGVLWFLSFLQGLVSFLCALA
ncbi:hypothetical protein Dimus_008526, partial [Dionaea muscipula]